MKPVSRLIIVCVASAVLAASGPALAKSKTKLAVMTIVDGTGKLPRSLIEGLTDALRGKLASSGQYIVIDKSRQAAALKKLIKKQKLASYKKCYSSKCQIPLGQALAADTILRTKLSRVGSTFILNGEMVDLAKEAVIKAAQASVKAYRRGRDDRLLRAVGDVAYKLTAGASGSAPPTMPPSPARGGGDDSDGPGAMGVEPDGARDARARDAAIRADAARQAALARQRAADNSAAARYAAQRRAALAADNRRGADQPNYGADMRKRRMWMLYGVGGLAAGAAMAGLGVYYLTAKVGKAKDRADAATSPSVIDDAKDEASKARATGLVFVGLGAAAAVIGTIFLATMPSLQQSRKVGALHLQKLPSAAPTPGGLAVSWGGRF